MEIEKLFTDVDIRKKIKNKLPKLFQLAEVESSRDGKIGMQVGSLRENIIVSLLIFKFGETIVDTKIPITEKEDDVKLNGVPLSIKTITNKGYSGVKLIWTVDWDKAKEFLNTYSPKCDMLLVRINWNGKGGFYHIPLKVQKDNFNKLGKEKYIKMPKQGTNPRGIEMSKEALKELCESSSTNVIDIEWKKEDIDYNQYERWVDYWNEN